MGRPKGTHNPGFDERRSAIARSALARLATPGGSSASLRELATAAGVGLPTVRHYFGDRDGLLRAAFSELRAQGEHWSALGRTHAVERPLAESLRWYLDTFLLGWGHGLGVAVSQSLAVGFDAEGLGPACVDAVLEPMVGVLEDRLAVHRARGELEEGADLRHAALALLSPVLVAVLHQHTLRGEACRALDVPAFLDDHVRRFVRAWGSDPRE